MKAISLIATFALANLLATGCATQNKGAAGKDWSALVGNYTYDQAVAELGKPAVEGEQSDGSRFAEWITRQSSRVSFGFGVGGGSIGSRSGVGVGVGTGISPPPHGEYLRLTFGKDGKLNGWSKTRH